MLNSRKVSMFLIFIMLAFSINASFSQDKDKKLDPASKANKISEKIQKKLNLSPEKTTAVNQAFLNYYTGINNFRTAKSEDKTKNNTAIKEIRNSFKTDLQKTLDERQMKKIKKFMNHRKHRQFMKHHMHR